MTWSFREGEINFDEIDFEGTIIIPQDDFEANDEQVELSTVSMFSTTKKRQDVDLLDVVDADDEEVKLASLNMDTLWRIVYEHQRYLAAEGFSDLEMSVLRAIERSSSTRVHISEIKEDLESKGIDRAESTIYNAIKGLKEKKLIRQPKGRGYYESRI